MSPEPAVRLRPFPFPYRAALAICSDIDGCDLPTFLAVHRYLNDPRSGLGLPVADSFFGQGRDPGQMAYFLPDGRTPGPEAHLIIQALRGGLIDSLHSWGDFNLAAPQPQALRSLAARLVEDLHRQGLSVKVWLNHGDPCNRQNLRARLQPGYAGDDPASPYYTADLLKPLGLKYYWWSDLVSWPLSSRPGLSRFLAPAGHQCLEECGENPPGTAAEGQNHRPDHGIVPTRHPQGRPVAHGLHPHLRGLKEPTSRHTLRYTLGRPVLKQLLAQEGYLILYTHLGLPRPGPGEELFPLPDRAALDRLAQHYHEGRIWVAPTVRVLTHWLMTRHLVWTAHREGERLIIHLESSRTPPPARDRPNLKNWPASVSMCRRRGRLFCGWPAGRWFPGSSDLITPENRWWGCRRRRRLLWRRWSFKAAERLQEKV